MHHAGPPVPTVEEIRSALACVTQSRIFANSPRLASFLRFVVVAVLDGRGHRLKGYTIAVEALGRDTDFDPQSDPIVRVEAVRLRRALERYYVGEGAADPVVIDLPRGHYVPTFRWVVRHAAAYVLWRRLRDTLQRLLAGSGARLLRPLALNPPFANARPARQNQQAQGAVAARPRRPRTRGARGDAAHDRADPRRL
jgi:hypothetical protein